MVVKSFAKTLERSNAVTQKALQSDTRVSKKLKGTLPQ